jgi:DNA repair protein RadC
MSKDGKMSIKEWAEEDRPREKLMSKGIQALSDAELIAILISSGNREETAVELSQRILSSATNNLNQLGKFTIKDLTNFKGIGEAYTKPI